MPYTDLTQLTDRYGDRMLIQLTDRGDVATGSVDTGVVDRALADTDAEIGGYLAARYVLPLATVPAQIADLAQVITIYKLHVYSPDPKITDDYKEAQRKLREISQGVIRLDVAGIEPDTTSGSGARITDRERPLTEANMKGFI